MSWSEEAQYEDNPFWTSLFMFYIKYKYLSCHWVGYSKINPIDVDKLFKRKVLNDEI